MAFRVTFTADHYTEESLAVGTAVENGYINPEWNKQSIIDESDEFFKDFDTLAEAEQYIEETIGGTEQSGDSYYGIDTEMDSEGGDWNYAGHVDSI